MDALPAVELSGLVLLLQAELLHDVLLRRLVRVQVQAVQDGQHVLGVAVLGVRHPAARLHLVRVQTPKLQLLLEERAAHVRRIVQLPRAVVVEDLGEDAGVPVEEVLIEDRVVVGQGLRQAGEAGGWDLLQRGLVGLVPDAPHVDDHAVVRVRDVDVHGGSEAEAVTGAAATTTFSEGG